VIEHARAAAHLFNRENTPMNPRTRIPLQSGSAQLNAVTALPNGDTWAVGASTTVRSTTSLMADPQTLVLET
jgi:hypothetical protein